MIEAMAVTLVSIIPDQIGGSLPGLIALISMPLSLVFTPDAYYYGVMPILAHSADLYGVPPIEVAQASVLGQMTVGFPLSPLTASTFQFLFFARLFPFVTHLPLLSLCTQKQHQLPFHLRKSVPYQQNTLYCQPVDKRQFLLAHHLMS